MGQPVVHFEIIGKDREKLSRFYSSVFGWNVNPIPEMNYGMVETGGGGGIAGGIGQGDESLVTIYIEVSDPQAYLDTVVKQGGKVVMPVMEIPGAVTMAQFSDPEGHVIGLVKAQA